ncbi:branched-chain amino acid ABC transporter permease [Nocardioides sp.]|uniref:branched-chain amino acid ABC transporter permease n=1 Tax=Nocardioides sp. TaxID=35761 RepID=UPI003528F8CC
MSVTEDLTTGSEKDEAQRESRNKLLYAGGGLVAFLVALAVLSHLPGTVGQISASMLRVAIQPQTAALVIAVIGLNIHFGYTGLLNMGQAGFMMLGAYGFSIAIWKGQPMVVGVLAGFAAAFVFALLLGIPTLKLRGDYLAIVTISAAEILRYTGRLAKLEDFTGAAQGIPGSQYRGPFSNLSFLGDGQWTFPGTKLTYYLTGTDDWWTRLVAWGLVALCSYLVFLLARSPWGRLLRGIREDEDAIRSLGKNVFAVKMQALVIGGLFGALGGIIFILPASMQPDAMGRNLTFFAWTALLLGGAATVFGPVLGSILFFSVRIFLQGVTNAVVPNSVMNTQQTEQFAWICIGVMLMLIVIFRPQGLVGDKRELRFNV